MCRRHTPMVTSTRPTPHIDKPLTRMDYGYQPRRATAGRSLPAQRTGLGPVSGRCAGEVPPRGAQRSGGFRGVAPRASTVPFDGGAYAGYTFGSDGVPSLLAHALRATPPTGWRPEGTSWPGHQA